MATKKKAKPLLRGGLSIKEELFCKYFACNRETFDNATQSYAAAYNYDLDSLSKEAVYETIGEHPVQTHRKIDDSPYDKACNVCAVNGRGLLRKAKMQARINELLLEQLTDETVDRRLSEIALQRVDMSASLGAIREYNKIKARTKEKIDITSGGKPLENLFNDAQYDRLANQILNGPKQG